MRLPGRFLLFLLAGLFLADVASAQGQPVQSVGGFLRLQTDEGPRPVEGVAVSATTEAGVAAGSAQSDARGRWQIDLAAPGKYVVRLDVHSLPASVTLRKDASNELRIDVGGGEDAIVLFGLVAGDAAAHADHAGLLDRIAQSLVDGLMFGSLLGITAIGLSLIYSVTGIVNFSHGDFVSFGALLATFLNAAVGGPHADILLAIAAAVVMISLLGVPLAAAFRSIGTRAGDHFTIMVFAIGLSFFFRHALLFAFGPSSQAYRQYQLQELYTLGPVVVAPRDLAVFLASVAVLVGIGFLLTRTRTGWAMRAVATNAGLAEQSGINVTRIRRMVWVLGSGLAAMGGALMAVSQQARWDSGYQLLMFMFAAVILGGIGTSFGALVGGLLIGLITQVSTLVVPPELKPAVAMLILVAVLLVRPTGLLSRSYRVG
jgi:branched-chain amino acid transport system permease protein